MYAMYEKNQFVFTYSARKKKFTSNLQRHDLTCKASDVITLGDIF